MKNLILLFTVFLLPAFADAQDKTAKDVKWYSMEQAIQLNREHPRKIFIYVYSDQCGWCRRMASNTLSNPVIGDYLNEKYYPVKINAGMKEDIKLGSKIYKYVPADPAKNEPAYHEFVVYILQGHLAYPSMAFLDQNLLYMGVERGYKQPANFEKLLHYIGDNAYVVTKDFEEYAEKFTGKL